MAAGELDAWSGAEEVRCVYLMYYYCSDLWLLDFKPP